MCRGLDLLCTESYILPLRSSALAPGVSLLLSLAKSKNLPGICFGPRGNLPPLRSLDLFIVIIWHTHKRNNMKSLQELGGTFLRSCLGRRDVFIERQLGINIIEMICPKYYNLRLRKKSWSLMEPEKELTLQEESSHSSEDLPDHHEDPWSWDSNGSWWVGSHFDHAHFLSSIPTQTSCQDPADGLGIHHWTP